MLLARDLMNNQIVTGKEDQYLGDAQYLMLYHNLRHLLILNDKDELVGILSRGDILLNSFGDSEKESLYTPMVKIKKLMTTNVISCSPTTPLADIAATMIACKIHCIPVVQGKSVVGTVSSNDFLQLFYYNKLECAS